MIEIGEIYLAQEDGGLPILASGNAPGESGVSVLRLRFRGGAHFAATTRRHLVWFQEAPEVSEVPFDCRIADGVLLHRPAPGRWPSVLPDATAPPIPLAGQTSM